MRDDDLPAGLGELTYGRVASVDLKTGRMIVDIGEIQTQPIRWFTGGSGGTRTWSRPKVGEQVILLAPEGDVAGAVALRGLDCAAFPPIGDEAREIIQFEDGARISYDPESHTLEAVLPADGKALIEAPGGIRLVGPVKIEGKVEVEGDMDLKGTMTATDDVVANGKSLKNHRHTNVQAGAAISGPPQ
jgi:phage baseplate assembly protein V